MKLGRAYVWNGSSWVDIGVCRNISLRGEPINTSRDAFGRSAALAVDVTAELTLMQADEYTLRNAIDSTSNVDLFLSFTPNPTLPSRGTTSRRETEGVILLNVSVDSTVTLDMGGGETATVVRFRTRLPHDTALSIL